MSKRILVGLDPSNYSISAQRVACDFAAHCGGSVMGLAVVDTKGIERAEAGGAVGAAHHAKKAEEFHLAHARETCEALVEKFADIARELGVSTVEPRLVEGDPIKQLRQHSLSADVVVIGALTYFHSETEDAPGHTLRHLLQSHICPVWVVPEAYEAPKRIILAYDASPGAARALRMFTYQTAGCQAAVAVTVLTVDGDADRGRAIADVARTYLEAHGRRVETVVEEGRAPAVVLAFAKRHAPALVVLGESAKGSVAEFFLGSVTTAMVEDGSVPLFVTG